MRFLKKSPAIVSTKNSNIYTRRNLRAYSFNKILHFSKPQFCTIGIKTLENCALQHYQLESVRKLFLPFTKRVANVVFKGNFCHPLTRKASGARMGKGKGKLSHWVAMYRRGETVLEFDAMFNELHYKKLLRIINYKMPFMFCISYVRQINI